MIEKINDPDYIIYQTKGRNKGHYLAIVNIDKDTAVALDIANYRKGASGTVNGEEGYYDVLITAYDELDEEAKKYFDTFEDYLKDIIASENVVYEKEKDKDFVQGKLSEKLSRPDAESLSINKVSQTGPSVKQNQRRENALSDREVLEQASSEINREVLTEGQRNTLETFDKYLAETKNLRAQINEQSELIKQYKEEQNTDELRKAQNRKAVLNNRLKRTEVKLLNVEDTKVAKELLERSRSIVET